MVAARARVPLNHLRRIPEFLDLAAEEFEKLSPALLAALTVARRRAYEDLLENRHGAYFMTIRPGSQFLVLG
jgi:hypothetical protein